MDLSPQTQPPLEQQKTLPENRLRNKFNHLQEYSNYNLPWYQNVLNGLTNSKQELSKRARLVSKSTQSLRPQEKKLKSSKPLLSCISAFSTNMERRQLQHLREGNLGQEDKKVTIQAEVHLDQTMDLNWDPFPLTLAQGLGKRKKLMSLTSLGLFETNYSETSLTRTLCHTWPPPSMVR